MLEEEKEELRKELEKRLPRFVFRNDQIITEYTGLNVRYMANLDHWGKGPKRRVKIGKKVAYPKQDLIEFIIGRIVEN